MNERTSIKRALEPLHASTDTLEEVLDMIDKEKAVKHMKKTGRSALRGALVAAILVIALSVTAYAVGEYTGFFDTVFGDESIGSRDVEHKVLTDDEGNVWKEYDVPGEERVPADQEMAEELVGDETASVGQSVKVQDVTFTVEDFVMDANGMGVLTYTMEDPNGFPGTEFTEEGGMLYQGSNVVGSLRDATLYFADENGGKTHFVDSCDFVAAGGTDTQKTVVKYFAPFEGLEQAENLTLTFHVVKEHDPDAMLAADVVDEGSVIFPLSQAVPVTPLTGPDGWSAGVSPVGLQIVPPEGNPYRQNYDFSEVVIHMTDGSEYVLEGGEPYMINITVGCYGEGFVMNDTFNRIIDPSQVESITAVGDGSGYQDENGRPVPYEEAWVDGNTLQDGLTPMRVDLDLTFTK